MLLRPPGPVLAEAGSGPRCSGTAAREIDSLTLSLLTAERAAFLENSSYDLIEQMVISQPLSISRTSLHSSGSGGKPLPHQLALRGGR
jgi:hypothetical protein